MKIGIVLDNPKRDLRGNVLLAYKLAELGASVYLLPMYEYRYDVPILALDAIVVNYARLTNLDFLERTKNSGTQIFVLDTEAGLLSKTGPRSANNWAKFISSTGLYKLIDGYFFWGSEMYDGFKAHSSIPAEKLFLTGTPRYDVADPKWQTLLPTYDGEKIVLINANFAGINPKFTRSTDFEIKMATEAGLDLDLIRGLIDDQKEIQKGFIAEVMCLVKENPKRNFVFRPHPFEGEEVYRTAFASLKNLVVESKGEIFDVLQASEILIHVNCTTAIDAVFAGIPSLSLNYINTKRYYDYAPLPTDISLSVNTSSELLEIFRRSSLPKLSFDERQEKLGLVEPQFGRVDGRSCERVAKIIVGNRGSELRKTKRSIAASLNPVGNKTSVLQFIQSAAVNIFGSARVSSFRSKLQPLRLSKRISKEFVVDLVSRISKIEKQSAIVVRDVRHPFSFQKLSCLVIEKE